ncbi:MAG: hypothetical protein IPM42_20050 [Saprospiraceae bacterium]|nr:hypothetical protein [Saprospiraceae bacterium]
MKNRIVELILVFIISSSVSYSQEDLLLIEKLENKKTLSDIKKVIDIHYKDKKTKDLFSETYINRQLKKLNRWEWYMSSRLGPDGQFVNINEKLIEATGLQQTRQLRSENAGSRQMMASGGNWTLIGPLDTENGIGRVDRLAFHPSNANTVYAGTSGGGLWRTTNGGNSWSNLTPDLPCLGVSGIAIDPTNTNIIYLLTGDGDSDSPGGGLVEGFGYMRLSIGVLKSTNGGSTWSKTGVFAGADYSNLISYRLTINPLNPQMLFACTNQGIFRTDNGGTTWNLVEDRGVFFNLKFKPGSATTCYAVSLDGSTNRFFKSTDGGLTFTDDPVINNLITNPASRLDLAVAQSNSSVVYILAGGSSGVNGSFAGLFRSSTSGDNFNAQSNSPNILGSSNLGNDNSNQSWYDLTMAVSNNNSNTVAVGAVFPWRSLDAGATWSFRGNLHGDIHELGYHPVDNKLWAATDGGVYSSTNNGNTWTSHFEGMSITQFYRMAVNPDNFQKMIAGCQDNGVQMRVNNTSTFEQINGSDGFTVDYDAVDTSVFYVIINRGIRRLTNSGANATTITPSSSANPFASTMAIHPSLANTVYMASDSFWRTNNATSSNNWTVSPNIAGGWALRTCPSNGNRIYIAGGNNFSSTTGFLRKSEDGGATWLLSDILSNNQGFPNNFPKITYINVNPINSNQVWVTFGGFTEGVKVFYSSNAGQTWVNRSGSLPNLPVNCIVLDNSNNAYIGTDNGVYFRGTGMADWTPFYNDLPYVPVTDLVISQGDNKIRASTFGRGIWSSDLYSPCETNLNIAGTISGQEFYEASQNISSTATMLKSIGTKVQMRGGNQVKLDAGFTAGENVEFRAAIGPCGSGGVAGFKVSSQDELSLILPDQYLPPSGGKKAIVHVHSASTYSINFEVHQKQEGKISIILTNPTGKVLRNRNFNDEKPGSWNASLNSKGIDTGNYYLYVLLDDIVQHMQEVLINMSEISGMEKNIVQLKE